MFCPSCYSDLPSLFFKKDFVLAIIHLSFSELVSMYLKTLLMKIQKMLVYFYDIEHIKFM